MLLDGRFLNYIILLLPLLLSATYTDMVYASDCNISDISNKIREKISNVRDYQFDSSVMMDGHLATSHIMGKVPKFMKFI